MASKVQTWDFAVRTDKTTSTGERRSQDSSVTLTATDGYYFDESSFTVTYNSQIGSENWVRITDTKRARSGILTGVTITAHARSKGGVDHYGERGSTTGRATITEVKL